MYHSRTRKVKIVPRLSQPSRPVPSPMRDWRINPASEDDGVGEVGEELASLGNGSGHDGGGGGSEHELREYFKMRVSFKICLPGKTILDTHHRASES